MCSSDELAEKAAGVASAVSKGILLLSDFRTANIVGSHNLPPAEACLSEHSCGNFDIKNLLQYRQVNEG
jgi:hypothetical protein